MKFVRFGLTGLAVVFGFAWASAQDPDYVPAKKDSVPESATHVMPPASAAPKGLAELQKGRGKLFVKESDFDYGFVAQDVKIAHNFILENVGKDTLFIERIKPT